jgi:hypothetical protein
MRTHKVHKKVCGRLAELSNQNGAHTFPYCVQVMRHKDGAYIHSPFDMTPGSTRQFAIDQESFSRQKKMFLMGTLARSKGCPVPFKEDVSPGHFGSKQGLSCPIKRLAGHDKVLHLIFAFLTPVLDEAKVKRSVKSRLSSCALDHWHIIRNLTKEQKEQRYTLACKERWARLFTSMLQMMATKGFHLKTD